MAWNFAFSNWSKSVCSYAPRWFSWCVGTSWFEDWTWDVVYYVCCGGIVWYSYTRWILPPVERFLFPRPPLYPDPPDMLILGSGPLNRHPTRPRRHPAPSPRLEAVRRQLNRLTHPLHLSHSAPPPCSAVPLPSEPVPSKPSSAATMTSTRHRTGTPTPSRAHSPTPTAVAAELPSSLPAWLRRMLTWRIFPDSPLPRPLLHSKRRRVARLAFRLVTYVAVPVVLAVCVPFGAGIALTPAAQACLQQCRVWSRLLLSWHNILAH